MDEFEIYKQHIRQHRLEGLKNEVLKLVTQRGLASVMNDTKWIALKKAVEQLPFPPPYIVKCITDENDSFAESLSSAPRYVGDWSYYYEEGMPPFFDIEWIKARPQRGVYRGGLIADEILDETAEFVAILKQHNIPFDEEDGIFTIYGYR